jgi:hypothetical protein
MEAAIDRVMHTYGMLVNLTAEQEQIAREKVSSFLASSKTDDENKLAVEGLRYLRASSLSALEGEGSSQQNSDVFSLVATSFQGSG